MYNLWPKCMCKAGRSVQSDLCECPVSCLALWDPVFTGMDMTCFLV